MGAYGGCGLGDEWRPCVAAGLHCRRNGNRRTPTRAR